MRSFWGDPSDRGETQDFRCAAVYIGANLRASLDAAMVTTTMVTVGFPLWSTMRPATNTAFDRLHQGPSTHKFQYGQQDSTWGNNVGT